MENCICTSSWKRGHTNSKCTTGIILHEGIWEVWECCISPYMLNLKNAWRCTVLKPKSYCELWSSQCGKNQEKGLLECNSVQFGRYALFPFLFPEMKGAVFSSTPVPPFPATWHNFSRPAAPEKGALCTKYSTHEIGHTSHMVMP